MNKDRNHYKKPIQITETNGKNGEKQKEKQNKKQKETKRTNTLSKSKYETRQNTAKGLPPKQQTHKKQTNKT